MRTPTILALFALGTSLPTISTAQTGPPPGSREAMWPAPTAEDWELPCLVTFERTFADALAVSKETGKPVLICVNMDGEIASEHYAGIRYRREDTAALYEPYVNVIASVYRHSPRDYDQAGRRILCPRFGSVTCGEHIAIEPLLYDKYFEGERVAPRHIGVELDGSEMYDVYYAFDTDSVFAAIREGTEGRPPVPDFARTDRPLQELVKSRHGEDRTAVEKAYVAGDKAARRQLLQAAVASGGTASVDMLRLAIFGLDLELNRLGRQALAQSSSLKAVDLIAEALQVPLETSEREALIAALDRLGEGSSRARTLAVVYRGLERSSEAVDPQQWSEALKESGPGGASYPAAGSTYPAPNWNTLESEVQKTASASRSRPEDGATQLELAESSLALAVDPRTAVALGSDAATRSKYAALLFEDVRRSANAAKELGATGWRVEAALALADYYLGDVDQAFARAEATVDSIPTGERGWNAMALLAIFAQGRQRAIADAERDKEPWPPQWLTDVHAAYTVLGDHPLGSDFYVVNHYDFLKALGAGTDATEVLDGGLVRFPESWMLHDRLRAQVLEKEGIEGLAGVYETMLADPEASPNLEWFAGYAALVEAEFYRRRRKNAEALAAYERGIAYYERMIERQPDRRDSCDHYVALAIAGRARIALEKDQLERSVTEILASFERSPRAAATLDGLGISPVGTAQMLRSRLQANEKDELAARVDAALERLEELDPELLRLPAFERGGPRRAPAGGRSRNRTRPGGQ